MYLSCKIWASFKDLPDYCRAIRIRKRDVRTSQVKGCIHDFPVLLTHDLVCIHFLYTPASLQNNRNQMKNAQPNPRSENASKYTKGQLFRRRRICIFRTELQRFHNLYVKHLSDQNSKVQSFFAREEPKWLKDYLNPIRQETELNKESNFVMMTPRE